MSGRRGLGRRPRVLTVVGAYYPEIAGGALQARTLMLALRHRVDFTVLTTTAVADGPARSDVDGLPVRRIFLDPRRPATKARAALKLAGMIGDVLGAADIFHFHGFTQKMVPLVAIARLARRPIVEKMTSVGGDDPVAMAHAGTIMSRAFAMADRFVCVSPAMRQRAIDAGLPESSIAFIPNAVDTERFRPADPAERLSDRADLGLAPDAWVVTFVGFWSREKRPNDVLDAWLRVASTQERGTQLVFVGATSPDHLETDAALVAEVRRKAAAAGVADRVRFVERTTTVERYLRASDVYIHTSVREGLPNALLEAMATGLPCVCTRLLGITDWLIEDGVNGMLVDSDDADGLAAALQGLYACPDRSRALGARARETVVSRCAAHTIADRYFDLYSDLMVQ